MKKAKKNLSIKKPNYKSENSTKQKVEYIRLNRFLSLAGICSRRQADEYIKAGLVSVNGNVVTKLGVKVKLTDDVRFNGQKILPEKKVYILLNKPKDCIVTTHDERGRKTVIDIISKKVKQKVFPVGRLDRNTTGVLLLTNDGELANKLLHPKYNKKKIYHAFLDKNLKPEHASSLVNGIKLDDGKKYKFNAIEFVGNDRKQVGIELTHGEYHIIRRMFEALGYKIKKLDRVYFAGLTKKGLERGKWRFLTEQEINMLKMGAYE
ncbi:MAG: rRNA pseudouridine synthase [Bacteroidales bacterium]|nr:rRNA pseudouridine synthase [Bacteroidales bacterium]